MVDVPLTREMVESALAELPDPETGRSATRMEQVRNIAVDRGRAEVTLGLTTWSSLLWEETRQEAERILRSRFPSGVEVRVQIVEHARPPERIGEIGLT